MRKDPDVTWQAVALRRGWEFGGKSAWETLFVKVMGLLDAHDGYQA